MSDFSVNNINPFIKNIDNKTSSNRHVYLKDIPNDSFECSKANKKQNKRGVFNKFIDKIFGYKTECTDGKDDGKLSFKEKIGSIARGALNLVTNFADAAIEHPLKTIGATAATIAGGALLVSAGIVSAPALMIGGAVVGIGFGAYKIASGIINAKKATNDADAKSAYEKIGDGASTAAVSAFSLKKGIKNLKEIKQISNTASEYAQSARKSANEAAEHVRNAENSFNSAKQSKAAIDNSVREGNNVVKETIKISDGVKDVQGKVAESEATLQNIIDNTRTSGKEIQTAQTMFENAKSYAKDAEEFAIKAEKAAASVRKASSVKRAAQHRDFAKEYSRGAQMAADAAKEATETVSKSASALKNMSDIAGKDLNTLYDTLKVIDTKINGTDYTKVTYNDDGIFGIDTSGIQDRTDIRTKIEMNSTLADSELAVKSIDINKIGEPQLPESSKYAEIGMPKINKRDGSIVYLCENLKDAPDKNGLRGKTPLAGKVKPLKWRMQKLKDAGIERVIDLRAEGECSPASKNVLSEIGVEYINFPVEDGNWSVASFPKIKEYIDAVNAGDFYVGCANGQARTDLAIAINYLFNPKAKNLPQFYYGSTSSSRVSLKQNITQIIDLVKESPDCVKSFGWKDFETFNTEFASRFNNVIQSLK